MNLNYLFMKKILLITTLILSNFCFAQFPKPTISGLSSAPFTPSPATSAYTYFTIAANGADATSYIQYSTNAATVASATSFSAGFTNATFSNSLTYQITGLQPNTTYYWRIWSSNAFGITYGVVNSFTTASTTPTISAIANEITSNISATINYVLNANSSATTSVINYGTSPANLFMQITGGTATGTTNTNASGVLNGLSLGGTYYYQIVATNSFGSTSSAVLSFTMVDMSVAVAEYNFNNTYNNVLGNAPFISNSGTSFTNDRNGTSNSALYINNTGTTSTILGLPYGNSARTVSVWVKMAVLNSFGFNFIYNYGNSTNYYGTYFNNSNLYHFQNSSSHYVANTTSLNTWIHYVFTYNGTESKIYKNGTLLGTNTIAFNTINNGNLFRLGLTENGGQNYFNGSIDDLKIYNYAISDADVTSLFTNNTLSSTKFNAQNLKATIYPNPTSDNFNIEIENEVKSVEIYSVQGQKMLTSNSKNIDVSNLSKGMYMVRIEDSNNAVSTQKLIIK
jgi:hypothetical protein